MGGGGGAGAIPGRRFDSEGNHMNESDYLYGTDELMPMVEALDIPGNFLLKLVFPEVMEFETENVHFDRLQADRRLAPLVSPLAPGKIQQPRGFQVETLTPAYLKPKNKVEASQVMRRRAGEARAGSMSPGERRAAQLNDYLLQHRTKVERRLEWMASSVLRTGQLILVSDDYPAVTVNYRRNSALSIQLSGGLRWGQNGVSPYDNVQTWIDLVGTTSNCAVNVVLMDAKAWKLFIDDPKSQKILDLTLGQTSAVQLGLQAGLPGSPTYKGRIGDVEFYVYNDLYEADDGTTQQLIPDFTVMLISQGGVEGAQMFGAIQDPRNNFGAARYFAKNWIDEDPAGEFLMTQSAPVLGPRRIDACACATVQ